MEFRPDELAAAHPWNRAVFTTYALSLSFFEAVVLDNLVRGGTSEAVIIADAEGVRAGLSEQGAQRAGRDYEIEPVAMDRGIFHAKISAFAGDGECHLVVGSGNLTFSGWGRSLEVAEHLHPSFAGDAFDDAARFFTTLASSTRATHEAGPHCLAIAADIERAAAASPRDGSFRLLHSLNAPIAESVRELADGLGGATRIIAAAPYWDNGNAISDFCDMLSLDHAFVHAHGGGTVEGSMGSNWPFNARIDIRPVEAEPFAGNRALRMHAKAFEILCRKGRILVSGSANATAAALTGQTNIEACVARVQRDRILGWTMEASTVPPPTPAIESDDNDSDGKPGVLRAVLSGDTVSGRVLSPRLRGEAKLYRLGPNGSVCLADLTLQEGGTFAASVPGVESEALRGGRSVLRIEAERGVSEGFASLASVTGLRRFTGRAAASFMSILTGTETEEDVRVLMEFFHDNPSSLGPSGPSGVGRHSAGARARPATPLAVTDLWNADLPAAPGTMAPAGHDRSWMRFMDMLLSAMREKRGPLHDENEPDDPDNPDNVDDGKRAKKTVRKGKRQLLETFEVIFDAMLPSGASHVRVMTAFDMASYLCERMPDKIPPGSAERWLRRLVEAISSGPVDGPRKEAATSLVMGRMATQSEDPARLARGRLLRMRVDLGGPPPSPAPMSSFSAIIGQPRTYPDMWEEVRNCRTLREQARFYVDALAAGTPSDNYSALLGARTSEAKILQDAFRSEKGRDKVLVLGRWSPSCPKCSRSLPKMEEGKLRAAGVATAANCCGRALVWPEGNDG